MHGRECIPVVAQAQKEEGQRHGCEQLQGRVQGGNLEDDQQEADSILDRTNVATVPHTLRDRNGDIGNRVGASEECHGAGRWVAKSVRQQMQELAEASRAYRTEARSQVHYFEAGHMAGQPVVESIGKAAVNVGLAAAVASADDHVVAFGQLIQQCPDVGRVMLPIGIHEHQNVSTGCACATFDRGTVTHRIGAGKHPNTLFPRNCCGGVGGAVIDYDDLCKWVLQTKFRQRAKKAFGFILGRQDDAELIQSVSPFSPVQWYSAAVPEWGGEGAEGKARVRPPPT